MARFKTSACVRKNTSWHGAWPSRIRKGAKTCRFAPSACSSFGFARRQAVRKPCYKRLPNPPRMSLGSECSSGGLEPSESPRRVFDSLKYVFRRRVSCRVCLRNADDAVLSISTGVNMFSLRWLLPDSPLWTWRSETPWAASCSSPPSLQFFYFQNWSIIVQ